MTYWRMQLHPADPQFAMRYAVESIAAGFIGLDFKRDVGDLAKTQPASLPAGEKDHLQFARDMAIGDTVPIIVHHYPFAIVTVSGEYNYVKEPVPELGVWFRHFRRIDTKKTRYHADNVTDLRSWDQLKMTDTISSLIDKSSKSYNFIEKWK
jgi:hypothetical protein